eukprot:CAMPEP_0170488206 /NCGR_PEP_ID=MMETSP0208-20121228/6816_1 /TAXON_ID=197538 /ORGANISM="Strombidium inclinatum, Strain S3" /LENGTH=178 /DNA_ID=CAMNT_0010762711 /DNA_START=1230 /DNA_END=1766 /DNA_ORIENTATION=-
MQFELVDVNGCKVPTPGWRYLLRIALKIITLNTFFYTRINEAINTLGTPRESEVAHLRPWIHVMNLAISGAVVNPRTFYFAKDSEPAYAYHGSIMRNRELIKIVNMMNNASSQSIEDEMTKRVLFGSEEGLPFMVGCSLNEMVALEFLRGATFTSSNYSRVLFQIRLDNLKEGAHGVD